MTVVPQVTYPYSVGRGKTGSASRSGGKPPPIYTHTVSCGTINNVVNSFENINMIKHAINHRKEKIAELQAACHSDTDVWWGFSLWSLQGMTATSWFSWPGEVKGQDKTDRIRLCLRAKTAKETIFVRKWVKTLKPASRYASCALAGRAWIWLSFPIYTAIIPPFGKPPFLFIFIRGHNAVFPEDIRSKLKTSTLNNKRASLRFVCWYVGTKLMRKSTSILKVFLQFSL